MSSVAIPPSIYYRNYLIVSLLLGLVVAILSGTIPQDFGLPEYPQTVVQFPTPVNAIIFGIVTALLCFLALLPLWFYVPKKKLLVLYLLSGFSAALLLILWGFMITYPRDAVLATQIYGTLFVIVPPFVICLAIKIGVLFPGFLGVFVGCVLLFVTNITFQNTITVNYLSGDVLVGGSLEITGSLFLSGQSPVQIRNVTQDIANSNYVFVSAPYVAAPGINEHVSFMNGATFMNTSFSNVYGMPNGFWAGEMLITNYVRTGMNYQFNTGLSMGNATFLEGFVPETGGTLPAGECFSIAVDLLTSSNTFLMSYQWAEFNFGLNLSLTLRNRGIYIYGCNITTSPIVITVGSLSFTAVLLDWEISPTVCGLLDCDVWCSRTQTFNQCHVNNCC